MLTQYKKLKAIAKIIEAVDERCLMADGPVTETRHEITNEELKEIYDLVKDIKPKKDSVFEPCGFCTDAGGLKCTLCKEESVCYDCARTNPEKDDEPICPKCKTEFELFFELRAVVNNYYNKITKGK